MTPDKTCDMAKRNGARERALLFYNRLGFSVCIAIAIGLVIRHGQVSAREGLLALAGVFSSYMAGVMAGIRRNRH